MKKKKALFIIGTRPDAIKMVSTIKEFKKDKNYKTIIIATSQHEELLTEVIDLFNLKIDFNLHIMRKNQSLSELSSRLIKGLGEIYNKIQPDIIFVQGDTSSSFLGALTGFYKKITVAHIEAGLRTFDKFSPFPEEINRVFIDLIADYLFPPTATSKTNLINSGVDKKRILVSGNTGIDALLMTIKMKKKFQEKKLKSLNSEKIITITTHRRESFGKPIMNTLKAIKILAKKLKDFQFVFPVHPNPNVKRIVNSQLADLKNVILTKPLNYSDFILLMSKSKLIITDSGGIQEEAPVLGKPVLILRDKTERPEAVAKGAAILVGTDTSLIVNETMKLIEDQKAYKKMAKVRYLYGDGNAGKKIYDFIVKEAQPL